VELLNWAVIDVISTAAIVSAVISVLLSLIAFRIRAVPRGSFWILLLAVFAFSMLGFVTGELLGDSRDSAVGSVVPAVLTLLGGVVAYIISSKGVRSQTAVSASLICFVFCFLTGSLFGIRLRVEYEESIRDPGYLGQRELALERNKAAVEIERLENYVTWLQLRNDYEEQKKLDLSHFQSAFEQRPSEEKKQTEPVAPAKSPPAPPAKTP
jgi:hypothetical protein